jgi:hypothetical protein
MVAFMAISLINNWLVKSKLGSPARDFFAVHTNAQSAGATPHVCCLLLARSGGVPVGCRAIPRFSADACEMKRL